MGPEREKKGRAWVTGRCGLSNKEHSFVPYTGPGRKRQTEMTIFWSEKRKM